MADVQYFGFLFAFFPGQSFGFYQTRCLVNNTKLNLGGPLENNPWEAINQQFKNNWLRKKPELADTDNSMVINRRKAGVREVEEGKGG